MRIVLAGGSGFLGRPLTAKLVSRGHEVIVLTRGPSRSSMRGVRFVTWMPDGSAPSLRSGPDGEWAHAINAADAVVNLAGEGIADRRWTRGRKHALRDSRVRATRSLIAAIRTADTRPAMFLNGSAIGYYGTANPGTLDESFPPGHDFLAKLCVDWEAEAHAVSALDCRLVIVRSGIVLARDGGALKKLLLPFLFFAGGPIGPGTQMMSWIHRDDWLSLVTWAIETPAVSGVLNATAPHPVSNVEFSRALGRAVHRPSWLPVPPFALRALIGEMADIALIGGQQVVPARPLALGFSFQYQDIDEALASAI